MNNYGLLTPGQIRAARGLVHWSQKDLGHRANLSQAAIANIENSNAQPTEQSLAAIRNALELAGLEFIEGGVRQRPDLLTTLGGDDFSVRIMDTIFETIMRTRNPEYLITGVSFNRANSLLKEGIRRQVSRLKGEKMRARILVPHNTRAADIIGPLEWHRRLPANFKPATTPCFVFHDCYATSLIERKQVVIMRNMAVVEDQRQKFQFMWQNAETICA